MARASVDDPLKVFRFRIVIADFQRGGFTEFTGVKKETDEAEYREGGSNESPQKSAGLSKYANVTMKRGQFVGSSNPQGDDDFVSWVNQVHQVTGVGTATNYRKDFNVEQWSNVGNNGAGVPVVRWGFREAWPKSETPFSDLNGLTSDNSFETLEVVHEGYTKTKLLAVST